MESGEDWRMTKILKKCKCGGSVVLLGGEPWRQDYSIFCTKCKGIWQMNTYSPVEAKDRWGYEMEDES